MKKSERIEHLKGLIESRKVNDLKSIYPEDIDSAEGCLIILQEMHKAGYSHSTPLFHKVDERYSNMSSVLQRRNPEKFAEIDLKYEELISKIRIGVEESKGRLEEELDKPDN